MNLALTAGQVQEYQLLRTLIKEHECWCGVHRARHFYEGGLCAIRAEVDLEEP